MRLFLFARSPYSAKALVAGYEKGIAFEERETIFPNDKAAMDALRAAEKEPIGQLPLLRLDDGTHLLDSTAICEWVDLTSAHGPRLVPEDGRLAVRARELDRSAEHLLAPLNYIVFARSSPNPNEKKIAFYLEHMRAAYDFYDRELDGRRYLVGDELTLADLAVGTALQAILRGPDNNGIDTKAIDLHPNLRRWYDGLAVRPSWKRVAVDIEKTPKPHQ